MLLVPPVRFSQALALLLLLQCCSAPNQTRQVNDVTDVPAKATSAKSMQLLAADDESFVASLSPNVEHLDASGTEEVPCTITAAALRQIAQCKHLKQLRLAMCINLDDSVLHALASLKTLERLDISSHSYWRSNVTEKGWLALESLPNLTHVVVNNYSSIPVTLFHYWGRMRNLKAVSLRNCGQIDDEALAAVGRFEALEELDISGDGVSREWSRRGLAALGHLACLRSLDVSGVMELDDDTLTSICRRCTQLTSLKANLCNSLECSGLCFHKNWKSVGLRYCSRVGNDVLSHLLKCSELKHLDIMGTACSLQTVSKRGSLLTLDRLSVDAVVLDGITPRELQPLLSPQCSVEINLRAIGDKYELCRSYLAIDGITVVDLASVRFTDFQLSVMLNIPLLTELDISDTASGLKTLFVLAKLPRLERLVAEKCDSLDVESSGEDCVPAFQSVLLSGSIVSKRFSDLLCRAPQLRSLQMNASVDGTGRRLAATSIQSAEFARLMDIATLCYVDLRGSLVADDGAISKLSQCRSLEYLDVSETRISLKAIDWVPDSKLVSLRVAFCKLGPGIAGLVSRSKTLRLLDLRGTSEISDVDTEYISRRQRNCMIIR